MASPQLCLPVWHLLLKLSWFLQTQELIFSFLSIFVLLNIYLHLAYILLLILVDLLFPLTSFLFLLLKSVSTPHSETRCLKSPSVLTFIILLKYLSFPYWFPHNIGALLSLPHTLSWNSHLQKVGTRNCLKYIKVLLQKANPRCKRRSWVSKHSLDPKSLRGQKEIRKER